MKDGAEGIKEDKASREEVSSVWPEWNWNESAPERELSESASVGYEQVVGGGGRRTYRRGTSRKGSASRAGGARGRRRRARARSCPSRWACAPSPSSPPASSRSSRLHGHENTTTAREREHMILVRIRVPEYFVQIFNDTNGPNLWDVL